MKYLITLLSILILFSCKKCVQPNNEITKIELARSGAWSDFGATISIDTSLKFIYFGDYGNVKQGYFVGLVSTKFWDSITRKLDYLKYKTIPASDSAHVVDVNYFELIIHWKDGKRSISRAWNYPPDSVLRVIKWIDTSFKKIKLRQVKDSIKFESKYHSSYRISHHIIFPPPTAKEQKKLDDE
jgi:hypothetical protein